MKTIIIDGITIEQDDGIPMTWENAQRIASMAKGAAWRQLAPMVCAHEGHAFKVQPIHGEICEVCWLVREEAPA